MPPQRSELPPHTTVPGYVQLNLPNPVFAVVPSGESCDALCKIATVPKIAICEDRDLLTLEHQIRTTRQRRHIRQELQPQLLHRGAEPDFALCTGFLARSCCDLAGPRACSAKPGEAR